jgi:DNA-directed RNA polymerase sigma subunit (sigma70/sigma32)
VRQIEHRALEKLKSSLQQRSIEPPRAPALS